MSPVRSISGRKNRSAQARAVVTGAGSGIGRALALELAQRGSAVVCADIDVDAAADTVEQIARLGKAPSIATFCDVSRSDDIDALSRAAHDHFSAPTSLLINNAGVGIGGKPVGDIGLDDWHWALGINLWGMVYGCEQFMPQLRASQHGGVINVASAAAFAAAPTMAAYNVGKAGVLALSETIAAESAGSDLNVTVLCPTFVKTNVARDGRITSDATALASAAMRMTGYSPERIARTTLDAYDRGQLYVIPQLDAKGIWSLKRHFPRSYTAGAGMLHRVLPVVTELPGVSRISNRIANPAIPSTLAASGE